MAVLAQIAIAPNKSAIAKRAAKWVSLKMTEGTRTKKISITLLFFFIAGLCEIGGGYLVWLWLRDSMSWMLGAFGGFVLFLYGVVPTFQPSHFHRIYAAYGGIFIVMAVFWGWILKAMRLTCTTL